VFKYNWLINAGCIAGLVMVAACMSPTIPPVSPSEPATGPNHAGPNAWNREDSEKRQAFCYAEVLKIVRQAGAAATNESLPAVKVMWFDCMNQNGGVI